MCHNIDAVMEELKVDTSKPAFCENLKLVARDQLSIARLWAVLAACAENEGGAASLWWVIFIPGLFNCKITATNGFIQTHFGHPNRDLKNPTSLSSHNTLLQCKPIVLSSLPPFQTCHNLIFVSLYAHVLHCLLKVLGAQSLESFSDGLTWSMLCGYVKVVVDAFTDGCLVNDLCRLHRKEDEAQKVACGGMERGGLTGDMIFENVVLFLCDGLILREFSDAIKSSDSGCVLLVLKLCAFSYQGGGHSKYAYCGDSLLSESGGHKELVWWQSSWKTWVFSLGVERRKTGILWSPKTRGVRSKVWPTLFKTGKGGSRECCKWTVWGTVLCIVLVYIPAYIFVTICSWSTNVCWL